MDSKTIRSVKKEELHPLPTACKNCGKEKVIYGFSDKTNQIDFYCGECLSIPVELY